MEVQASVLVEVGLKVLAPILSALFIWALNKYLLKAGPQVVYQLVHAAEHPIQDTTDPNAQVHTHSLVVRNAGKKSATNVCIGHYAMPPSVRVWPPVPYRVTKMSDHEPASTASELVFPSLAPNQAISVAYLYPSSLTVGKIHGYVKSDEGFAEAVVVSLSRPFPWWAIALRRVFVFLGVWTALYWMLKASSWFITIT